MITTTSWGFGMAEVIFINLILPMIPLLILFAALMGYENHESDIVVLHNKAMSFARLG